MSCWHFWHQYRLFTHHLKAQLNPSVSLAPLCICLFCSSLYFRQKSNQLCLTPTSCWGLGLSFLTSGSFHRWTSCPQRPPASPCSQTWGWSSRVPKGSHSRILARGLTLPLWLLSWLGPFPPLEPCPDSLAGAGTVSPRHGVTQPEVRLQPQAGALREALLLAMLRCGNIFLPFSW